MMEEVLMSEGIDDAGDAGKLRMPQVTRQGAQKNKRAAAFATASSHS
jgi:hypothetical protein